MERINAFVTTPQRRKLERLVNKTGLSMAELLRRAIDQYLERLEDRD